MTIDLIKCYTHFFKSFDFYEYLSQKNIDHYEEQNDNVKVRKSRILFKYATLMSLNEANDHNSKHGLKEILEPDKKNGSFK